MSTNPTNDFINDLKRINTELTVTKIELALATVGELVGYLIDTLVDSNLDIPPTRLGSLLDLRETLQTVLENLEPNSAS